MTVKLIVAAGAAALLSACGSVPMTPAEFREAAKASKSYTVETFEVKRSFTEVSKTISKKVPECLTFDNYSTKTSNLGFSSSTTKVGDTSKPTVVASAKKMEVYFQKRWGNPVGPIPKDGWYYFVADIYPVAKDRTKVDIYQRGVSLIDTAMKGWASGDNLGCPDPTQIF
jgi:hypothetical protein